MIFLYRVIGIFELVNERLHSGFRIWVLDVEKDVEFRHDEKLIFYVSISI